MSDDTLPERASHRSGPTGAGAFGSAPTGSQGNKQALFDAAVDVMRRQAEERATERDAEAARQREQSRVSPIIAAGLTIILAVGVYIAIEQPTWLFPPPRVVESTEVQEASLRIGMATTAQRIERFRMGQGRLPRSLNEAGSNPSGIQYEQREGDRYVLRGANGTVHVVFNSGDSLPLFVGNSFRVLAQRTGR